MNTVSTCNVAKQLGLADTALERYSRQFVLSGWSAAVQKRLQEITVALPCELHLCARYLAGAGVTKFYLIGSDAVAASCATKLQALQSDVELLAKPESVDFSIQLEKENLPLKSVYTINIGERVSLNTSGSEPRSISLSPSPLLRQKAECAAAELLIEHLWKHR